jgi:predicted PhzF superfamily epimerase YddE/YHI9
VDVKERVLGLIVTVKGGNGSDYDFVSRYFGPWIGIPEDPVTGSSFTVLAPFWSAALGGKREMSARQCSRRGADLTVLLFDGAVELKTAGTILIEGTIKC